MTVTDYSDSAVRSVCYDCGSPIARQSYNYFRRIHHVAGDKVWSRVWSDGDTPVAFYVAVRCRDHVRLIEIAVRSAFQKRGVGKAVLAELVARTRSEDLHKITFRTPRAESAQGFWAHVGARIMDVKGNDYEMTLTV